MCGWVGVFGAPVQRADLTRAGALLQTRGPDGSGERLLERGPLTGGFAHRRLAILDLSDAGAQPMVDEERGVSLVYNGELYNAPELRRELEAGGARLQSRSDTEVLLRGWIEWGDAVLERIEGIFAFALADERAGRVLLARDRTGVKPLYWAHQNGVLVAGSAPRALLALRPALGSRLDEVALAEFLTLLWIPHPRTPWQHIRKLEPGCALVFHDGRIEQRRYWAMPDPGVDPVDAGVLRGCLREVTTRQLLADVEVGVLFSGGLDSTLLVRFLLEGRHQPLVALTAGYDPASQRLETVPDDLLFARTVARREPALDLREVPIDGEASSALEILDRLAMHFDDPVADPAALTLWQLCRESPHKVLLSGVGGEELFAGYPRHGALGHARRLASLPGPVRRALGTGTGLLAGGRAGPLHGPRRNVEKLLRACGTDRPVHYWRLMSQLGDRHLRELMPDVAEEALNDLDALSPPLATIELADALRFDRLQFLPSLNLAYVDKASMAASVEVRVPLLDERLVSLVAPTDPGMLLAGSVGKRPLRDAARGVVPDEVIDRPKTGFGGPVRRWFQGPSTGALRERIEAAADTGLVARQEARRIYADASTGRQDMALAAWALVCLGAWYDAIGRRGEGP
jgi:asparagine synthase (glutamine-hydrolysing)